VKNWDHSKNQPIELFAGGMERAHQNKKNLQTKIQQNLFIFWVSMGEIIQVILGGTFSFVILLENFTIIFKVFTIV